MKTFILCCAVAVFATTVSAQFGLGSLMPPGFSAAYNTITTVHSVLSKTPLAPFLPSTTTMVMNAIKVYQTASSIQDGTRKAMESVNNAVQQAAAQANLSPDAFAQITQQMNQMWNSASSQAQQAAAGATNFLQAPVPASG